MNEIILLAWVTKMPNNKSIEVFFFKTQVYGIKGKKNSELLT